VPLSSIEICAGGGGQAIGLEQAGFEHLAVVELERHSCATLRANRPYWNVVQADVTRWSAAEYRGAVDLFAGGVPCPPFSKAGRQLGKEDERDLFPHALRLIRQCRPRAVMLENVRGLLDGAFAEYRVRLEDELYEAGYATAWALLNASDFGVPQLRPRTILVALPPDAMARFSWPRPARNPAPTVGEALLAEMASGGWEGAEAWAKGANRVAPTLVGGSHKHGGPDLGPTRARKEWATLGVDGGRVADNPPGPGHRGMPHLTVRMTATLQGFPESWRFQGKRTHAYRQVGNAFPPPVAKAVGLKIAAALRSAARIERAEQLAA
jgi:DNA (cytosine-5)-methyltransferase 1